MTSNVSRDFARRAHAAGVPQVLEKALLNSGLLTAIRHVLNHIERANMYICLVFLLSSKPNSRENPSFIDS